MENVLEIEHLSLSLPSKKGKVPILHDVNLTVGAGKILGLVGESGSGKSMTAFAVTRLLPGGGKAELGGSIRLMGRQLLGISEKSMEEVRGRDVSMIFQEPMTCLNPVFTIGTQMTDVIRTHEKMGKEEAEKKALVLLEEVHIRNAEDVLHSYPYELSGGMRQRVVIAIALSCDPDLLICDEPTTALDVTIQAKILELIRSIQRERGISVIYITHDLGVVAKVADYVDVMYAGKIVETGTIDEIFYDPRHPYTWGLLSAMPDLDTADERLYTIPGSPPNLLHEKAGDAFAPRNKYALEIDDEIDPPMFKISDTHFAATWLLDPRAPKVEMPPELKDRVARMRAEAKKIEEAE